MTMGFFLGTDRFVGLWTLFLVVSTNVYARPVVRNIRSTHEFDRLLAKHSTETGLPVIVDFYSDSCGPCRMMAPIFKQVGGDYVDKAVYVKVDTNAQYEISSRYQIRSLPTFQAFVGGRKVDQAVGGIGEGGLRQFTDKAVRTADIENVLLPLENLKEYYAAVDPSKAEEDIETVYQKCVDMVKGADACVGGAASQLTRKLKKKYSKALPTAKRFTEESRKAGEKPKPKKEKANPSSKTQSNKPNLNLATIEELKAELEKRLDEERDAQVDAENLDEDEPDPDYHKWSPGPFPEKMVIIGGGPAGMAAAIYGARAGLSPLVIAPSMGGQLQGKGVDVENYPGLANMTGPGVVASMRRQAAHFGTLFEDETVVSIDTSSRPYKIQTNSTGSIEAHTIIVATGADSNWLGVPGEWELRGGGVSSCATCDGFLYSGQDVVVVGGGDTAMEEALVLARTSKTVTVLHRRDQFRASKVLADRVLNHRGITVKWNTTLQSIESKDGDTEKLVSGVVVKDVSSGEESRLSCEAVFIAIGHTPNTSFLKGITEFDPKHPGYLLTFGGSTQTSMEGIFAAGDVSDPVYRQAITSAGSGAAAALDAERYLSENALGNEAEKLEAELMAELMDTSASASSSEGYNAYEDAGGRMHGMKESVGAEL